MKENEFNDILNKLGIETIKRFSQISDKLDNNHKIYLGIKYLENLVISFFISSDNFHENIDVFCKELKNMRDKICREKAKQNL